MHAKCRSKLPAILFSCLAAGCGWAALSAGHAGTAEPPAARPVAAPPKVAPVGERKPDQDALREAIGSFAEAFEKGDAKAVAAHWTANGEYIADDGTTIRGRAELEKDYADAFGKGNRQTLEVEVESVRFPSRDNAVVEGHFKLRRAKTGEFVASRCSFLFAREDGKWLIAIARESPGDGLTVRDLEWLIGTWEAKREGTVVSTKYEWTTNKTFVRCNISIAQDGKTLTGMQMIGKMPSTGGLHAWTFEDSGGIGDADITRDGKKWMFAARGSTADGRVLTATNIMTPVDADSFLWHAVERTLDGEPVPDQSPIKVNRVKATK